jgi:hypothetical protein
MALCKACNQTRAASVPFSITCDCSHSSLPMISEASIRADAERHSHLHSWYKHLSHAPGTVFLLFFARGEQERNELEPGVKDKVGWHLWLVPGDDACWDETGGTPRTAWDTVVLTREYYGAAYASPEENRRDTERQRMLAEIVAKGLKLASTFGEHDYFSAILRKANDSHRARLQREFDTRGKPSCWTCLFGYDHQ